MIQDWVVDKFGEFREIEKVWGFEGNCPICEYGGVIYIEIEVCCVCMIVKC